MLIEVLKKALQRKNKPQQRTNILAELLSKEKREASPQSSGVLPTLARSYGKSGKSLLRNYRYLRFAVVSLVIVVMGIGTILYSKRLKVPARQQAVLQPLPQQPRPLLQQRSSASQPQAPQPQEPPPARPPVVVTPAPVATVATAAAPRATTKAVAIPAKKVKKVKQKMTPQRGRTTPAASVSKVVAVDKQQRESASATPGGSAQVVRGSSAQPKVDTAASGALLYAARSAEQGGDWHLALDYYQQALRVPSSIRNG
jgi:hypothetical protein